MSADRRDPSPGFEAGLKQAFRPAEAPEPAGAYSPGIRVGDLVFASGQVPIDPRTGELVEGTIEVRTTRALHNLETVLNAAGASRQDVVKVSAHIESFDLFDGFDAAYGAFFGETPPARTTVASDLGGIQVEIDAIAVVPSRSEGAPG